MITTRSNLPQRPLKIKQDDKKVISKRLTRDVSMAHSCTEEYHVGASVAVPFTWESQPGTPKINFRGENPLRPLTPPPSYFYSTPKRSPIKKQHSKTYIFDSIFPKRSTRKSSLLESPAHSSSSSSPLSSSWSSSHSMPSSPISKFSKYRGRNGISSPRQCFDAGKIVLDDHHEGHENECESPVSTLCFGIRRGTGAKSRGCYASIIKVLLA